ncbi:hypothetical protein EVAR_92862_1 [Eumeta japonica]|uniref:Uncharacterized protein n=1 Tax=Eumeta variegata TaxID=151549 RepID=A0A4C1TB17_EUMVA|nr:hypothetical protein EVAR_92862_1 [Eumeta japonica]
MAVVRRKMARRESVLAGTEFIVFCPYNTSAAASAALGRALRGRRRPADRPPFSLNEPAEKCYVICVSLELPKVATFGHLATRRTGLGRRKVVAKKQQTFSTLIGVPSSLLTLDLFEDVMVMHIVHYFRNAAPFLSRRRTVMVCRCKENA